MSNKRFYLMMVLALGAFLTVVFITASAVFSLREILIHLPESPSAALIGLLQNFSTGLVSVLSLLVGAVAGAMGSMFIFKSMSEAKGDDNPETQEHKDA